MYTRLFLTLMLMLAFAVYAIDSNDAMEQCMKTHSRATCNHNINR